MAPTLTVLEPNQLAFVDSVDQDQTAQDVQSNLWSALSTTWFLFMAETTLKYWYLDSF